VLDLRDAAIVAKLPAGLRVLDVVAVVGGDHGREEQVGLAQLAEDGVKAIIR
jgi:hypothetical protein